MTIYIKLINGSHISVFSHFGDSQNESKGSIKHKFKEKSCFWALLLYPKTQLLTILECTHTG